MATPYDVETMLLGATLEWGKEVTNVVLPRLTADKFLYGPGEALGSNSHRAIWQAVEQCALGDRAEPFVGNVARYLGTEVDRSYLDALTGLLKSYHRIHRFDPESARQWATQVDRNGVIYRYAALASEIGKIVQPDVFVKYVGKVDDVDAWANAVLREFQGAVTLAEDVAYQPISQVVEEGKEFIARQAAGEQLVLLPVGMPIIYRHGLFPVSKFAIVHGWTSAGKSMFVHLVNLGTAIGLVKQGMKGCVAINSLEMSSLDFARRCASALAGFNSSTLLGDPKQLDPVGFRRFEEYFDFIGKLPIVIDQTPGITPDRMRLNLNSVHLSERGPVRQHSSDYMELFETSSRGRQMSEKSREQELAYVAKEHYLISRELGCSVISISQSTYAPMNKDMIAGLDGMRYSKALSHKADIVIEVINYKAAEKAGKNYVVRPGLDNERVWLLLQKYKEGNPGIDIPMGWEPESTRLYDPTLLDDFASQTVLFEHQEEVKKLLAQHPTTTAIPLADTPLAELDFS